MQPELGQFWSFSAKTTHSYGQNQKPLQYTQPSPKLNQNNCYFGVKPELEPKLGQLWQWLDNHETI